jgi:dCTP deaminase
MFWAGETLRLKLKDLINEFDETRCDRATYRLRIGPEIYVSPTGLPDDPKNKPKTLLKPGQGFTVPAGQFALLLTEESVEVPSNALAFISMRARYKYRGLVNVSGFHVDPGFKGRLIFAAFNAGPGPVHLARGEECFHIWYASLEGAEELPIKPGYDVIPSDIINSIGGEIQSFAGLDSKIKENEKKLTDRVVAVEREQAVIKWAAFLVLGVLITVGVRECSLRTAPTSPVAQAPQAASAVPSELPKPASPEPQTAPPAPPASKSAPTSAPSPKSTKNGS